MSKRLTRAETTFGVPSVALRNALRKLGGNSLIEPEWFAKYLKVSNARCRQLAHDLQAEGWLAKDTQYPEYLALTELGHRFTIARATQPMKRKTADRLLDGAIRAAKDINADGSMTHFVEELYVFGSYLSDRHEIGDLDLGVKLGRRLGRLTNEQWSNWCRDIGYASSARNIVAMLFHSENLVLRRLKQRSKYVAIHPLSDLDQIGAERRLIFRRGKRVAAPKMSGDPALAT